MVYTQNAQAFNTVDPEGPSAKAIAIVTTPNDALFGAIQTIFNETPGLASTELFKERMPTGNTPAGYPFLYTASGSTTNDTFTSIIRYTAAAGTAGATWANAPQTNVMSFRVKALTTTGFTEYPYPPVMPGYYAPSYNTDETANMPSMPGDCADRTFQSYYCDILEIAADIEGYMSTSSPGVSYTLSPTNIDPATGGGTNGPTCINNGTSCAGGNEDNSAYRNLDIGSLTTSGPAYFIGVNHSSSTGDSSPAANPTNNAYYTGVSAAIDLNNRGVTDLIQPNVTSTFPSSPTFSGSAAAFLSSIGVTPSSQLSADLPNLYVGIFYRSSSDAVCSQPYCVTAAQLASGTAPSYITTIGSDLGDLTYIPPSASILLTERGYSLPPSTSSSSPPAVALLTGAIYTHTQTPYVLYSPGTAGGGGADDEASLQSKR